MRRTNTRNPAYNDRARRYNAALARTTEWRAKTAAANRSMLSSLSRQGYYAVPRTRGAIIETEWKYFDAGLEAKAIVAGTTWTGTEVDPAILNTLCVPQKGAGINERIGRRVSVKKIKLRGDVGFIPQTLQPDTDNAIVIRIILFMDKQTNATQAKGEEVFANPTTGQATNAPYSWQSLKSFGRFRVLKDKMITFSNVNATGPPATIVQAGMKRPFKFTHTFRDCQQIHFNDVNNGTVADIVDNSFHVLCIATNTLFVPTIRYESRCVYMDK